MTELWRNQREALEFALDHEACMLDMEMGTGKTRVAIESILARDDVYRVLVVCPKAVTPVWSREVSKYAPAGAVTVEGRRPGETVKRTEERLREFFDNPPTGKSIFVVNYESVWRDPLGDALLFKCSLDMVILDESHRAKAAGSKVSKFLSTLGRRVKYRMCLSGTPMANSPLDVYGQYRFLDREIFGTNHNKFLQEYAIMGGPERRFVVGFKNQQQLMDKFDSIAYTCKMSDLADRIKLPDALPPVRMPVQLPAKDMKTLREFSKEFVAECAGGFVVANNVLVQMLRIQQITSGFCSVQENPLALSEVRECNTAKADMLADIMDDLDPRSLLVVFCVFQHDLDTISEVTGSHGRPYFELSGRTHQIDEWKASEGGVVAVQIQAGAEGVDMTMASHAVYFSLPHSLALYDQSKARLYRPGQNRPVSFVHLVAEGTIDEGMYTSLINKHDVIESIKDGSFDFGYLK